jgi:hypothetical protein
VTSSQSPPIPWAAAALNIQEQEIYRSKSGGDGALVLCCKRGLQGLIERDSIGLWDEAVGQGIHWLSTPSRRWSRKAISVSRMGIAGDATFDYQFVVNPTHNCAFTPVSAFEPSCPNRNGLVCVLFEVAGCGFFAFRAPNIDGS